MKEQYELLKLHTNQIFENQPVLMEDIDKSLYNQNLKSEALLDLTINENEYYQPLFPNETKFVEMLKRNQESILTNPIFSK